MEDDETKGDWISQKVVEHIDALNKIARLSGAMLESMYQHPLRLCTRQTKPTWPALREQQSSLACTTTCGSGRRGRIRALSRRVYHRWCYIQSTPRQTTSMKAPSQTSIRLNADSTRAFEPQSMGHCPPRPRRCRRVGAAAASGPLSAGHCGTCGGGRGATGSGVLG